MKRDRLVLQPALAFFINECECASCWGKKSFGTLGHTLPPLTSETPASWLS